MRHWFQDLNENNKKLFHFRGSFRTESEYRMIFKYELCSGPSFSLKYSSSEDGSMIIVGLFFFTMYLTSRFFKMPFLTYGRDYGFYFHEWILVWHWGTVPMSWDSKTPKWRDFTFNILDLFFGRIEMIENDLVSKENIKFKIGTKDFTMNSIKWLRKTQIRRHIPYSIWKRSWISVEMKIDNPPMRSGKGENSWDCDDDGSFGMYARWKFEIVPNWHNVNECSKLAVGYYCDSVLSDAKKYGSGSGEYGVNSKDSYEVLIEHVQEKNL